LNDKEKELEETIDEFFKQFGNFDIYTQIVLEEFFKEICNK